MAISRIFDISNRSMQAYQKAIDITANNITNASNPNYSRRRLTLASEKTQTQNGIQWGMGVTLGTIQRVRDNFVDNEYRKANQNFAKADKKSWIYDRVEQLFNETSGSGLSDNINQFFASWNELSTNPSSIPLRNNVINSAQILSSKIEDIYGGVDTIAKDVITEYELKVGELNNKLSQIQDYNAKISNAYRTGKTAADLEDSRDVLVDELSTLVNMNVHYDKFNSANISIGGVMAVDSSTALVFESQYKDGKISLVVPDKNLKTTIKQGELGALTEVYNNEISGYKENLDFIFKELVSEVNNVHSTGSTLENPPQTGINFFDEFVDGKLKLNSLIENDPRLIAASSDGSEGNSDIALQIASLADSQTIDGYTFNQKYINMLTEIGNNSQAAKTSVDSNEILKEQLDNQRSSYSGVSIDEEMSNLILYQKSYDASAKLVKMANDMLDTLINMV